jgi:hypothetical protein
VEIIWGEINMTEQTQTNTNTNNQNGGGGNNQSNGGGTPPEWFSGFNDDLKGYVQNKGFKDSANVVQSYRDLEKLIGVKDQLVHLPTKPEDAEGWNKVYDRLGRPAKAEEYKFDVKEDIAPKEFQSTMQQNFHKLGLSKTQGEGIMKAYAEFSNAEVLKTQEASKIELEKAHTELKKEWGLAHEQNTNAAKKAVTSLGVKAEVIDQLEAAMGYQGVMKFFHAIGSKIGEDSFVNGGGSGFNGAILSPEAAMNKIAALKSDPDFTQKYLKGDVQSKAEMERLHKMAYPEIAGM